MVPDGRVQGPYWGGDMVVKRALLIVVAMIAVLVFLVARTASGANRHWCWQVKYVGYNFPTSPSTLVTWQMYANKHKFNTGAFYARGDNGGGFDRTQTVCVDSGKRVVILRVDAQWDIPVPCHGCILMLNVRRVVRR